MTTEIPNLLIFGYGNPSRGDDALGPLLLERLERALGPDIRLAAGGIEFLTDFQLQVEDALDLADRKLALFIDAHSKCAPPYRFERIRPAEERAYTTHALSPAAVLSVYQKINGAPPPPCFLLGIRGEAFELGAGLSDPAEAHLEAALRLALELCAHPCVEYWQSRAVAGD